MSGKVKFIIAVIASFLASSLVLTGCMYAVASDNGQPKEYVFDKMEDEISNIPSNGGIESTPTTQIELHEKFSRYIHTDGNTVTVFSEEQYAELQSVRERRERIPLTYDEVLFLINDSINLYFAYDEIRLTNAVCDGISHNLYLSSNAEVIYPYHGDYSEFDLYDEGYAQYEKMIDDIFSVIYYRIYMHDAGFETITESYRPGKGTIVYADGYEIDYDGNNIIDPRETESGAVTIGIMQLLSLNGGEVSGKENKDHLVSEWGKMIRARSAFSSNYVDANGYEPEALEAPMLVCYHQNGITKTAERRSQLYELYVIAPETLETTLIFPTYELKNMMPTGYSMYVSGEIDGDKFGTYFSLNKYLGAFTMSLSSTQSFALTGKYTIEEGVLRLYPINAETDAGGSCCYVFYNNGEEWVYSRDSSIPSEGSFDIKDGLSFRYVKDELFTAYYNKPLFDIRDMAKEQNIPTDTAMEKFFEDDEEVYYFPSVKSEYVIATFADGSAMTVKEALEKGYIHIRALDIYGIRYISEKK